MKMVKLCRVLLILTLSMGILVGCRDLRGNLPDYRDRPFRAEVRWSAGGVTMCAEVVSEYASKTGGSLCVSELIFCEPPSLSGMRVFEKDGGLCVSRDGLEMNCVGAAEWWSAVSVLCAEGELRGVCDTELSGLRVQYAELKNGDTVYEVYRLPDTGEPKRIVWGEHELTVIRFERIEGGTNEDFDVDECDGGRRRGNASFDALAGAFTAWA